MGQKQTSNKQHQYKSEEFFKQQIELYRWRADPKHNQNICRVTFHLQQSIKDKEILKYFLQHQFIEEGYISLNDLMKLASQNSNSSQEELMTFQNYVCTLADLEEKLTLPETLYTIHTLFCGYQAILGKIIRLKARLNYCFVTKEGEVRAWYNHDFKVNEQSDDINEVQSNNPLITSEIGMIKKILEFGQKLASVHTEFLHFSRQFKYYMERDILQNWTLSNARRLVNSYAYTYKVNLPTNLKEVIRRLQKDITNSSFSQVYTSSIQSQSSFVQSNCLTSKSQYLETGPSFNKKMVSTPNSGRKEYAQRPASYSDFSSKNSEELIQNSSKTHSKKYASTDLKNFQDRRKKQDSSKVVRSDMLSQHSSKSEPRKKRQTASNHDNYYHKVRRQRQYASIDGDKDTKMNTTEVLTPNNNSFAGNADFSNFEESTRNFHDKVKMKESTNSGILKHNQCNKQKKKLEKKAAVVSKYISFFQDTKPGEKNDASAPELSNSIVQQLSDEKSNPVSNHLKTNSHYSRKQNYIEVDTPKSNKISFTKKEVSVQQQSNIFNYSPMTRKPSFEYTPKAFCNTFTNLNRGNTEYFRNFKEEQSSEQNQSFCHQNQCFTIKTVNKLIDNNEVSLHESIGSFGSVPQSQGSEYKGMLSKMGRSVDIVLPSQNQKHYFLHKKPISTSNNFNNKGFNNN